MIQGKKRKSSGAKCQKRRGEAVKRISLIVDSTEAPFWFSPLLLSFYYQDVVTA